MIIFSQNGDLHGEFSLLPNESYLDESKWTIAELPEGESFDPDYKYSCVDGVAIKGSLIPENLEEKARMKAEFDATQYQRKRREKYPSIQDCIHALLDGGDTLTELQAKRQEVKKQFPKSN